MQTITDFWQYFDPARQFMPKNCSADVQAVIEYVDFTFTFGSDEEIDALKNNFGLGAVKHLDDAAGACECFIRLTVCQPTDEKDSAQQLLGLAESLA